MTLELGLLDNRYMFFNDEKSKYNKYIDNKIDEIKKDIKKIENKIDNKISVKKNNKELALLEMKVSRLTTANLTGLFIFDVTSGVCNICDMQYSVPENSLMWVCPSCGSVNVRNELKILHDGFHHKIRIGDIDFIVP